MENTQMNNDKMLEQITEKFGISTELCKLSEEVGELLGECYKSIYTEETLDIQHAIEDEFADVMVILSQIKLYFGLDDKQINDIFNYKINRTVGRINEGWYDRHR